MYDLLIKLTPSYFMLLVRNYYFYYAAGVSSSINKIWMKYFQIFKQVYSKNGIHKGIIRIEKNVIV